MAINLRKRKPINYNEVYLADLAANKISRNEKNENQSSVQKLLKMFKINKFPRIFLKDVNVSILFLFIYFFLIMVIFRLNQKLNFCKISTYNF